MHLKMKDAGVSLIPWFMMYFFIAVCLFLLLFSQNITITTKYMIQDSLAAAALAGEIADLDVLSRENEVIIKDLDYAKQVFWESLQASLQLDAQGFPQENSIYFDSTVPITVEELTVYNVSRKKVYKTDLLRSSGSLQYDSAAGLTAGAWCSEIGSLCDEHGNYIQKVAMLDGTQKEIHTTSLYAKIRFGIRGINGGTIILEKDVLTDIQENQ